MTRYVATALVALLLLVIALYPRGGSAAPGRAGTEIGPSVRVAAGPDGRVFTVTHTLRGSVTRAALVYALDGEERTAAVETDCRRSLARGASLSDDGYATVVELTGTVPPGASNLRLVIESETGTDVHPLEP